MEKNKTGIKKHMQNLSAWFKKSILNPRKREFLIFEGTFGVLGIVSLFMSILNVITREYELLAATSGFFLGCILCSVLFLQGRKSRTASKIVFQVMIFLLMVFFTVSGYPSGFSVIWAALFPACGLIIFGFLQGTVLSAAIWAELIFFFYTSPGQALLRYEYNPVFMLRFPFLFFAFYLVGLTVYTLLQTTQNAFHYLSEHDQLTDALNRTGFQARIDASFNPNRIGSVAFLIADIDHFKAINDTYGHFAGDTVLKKTVELIRQTTDAPVCRWGGEEFAIFFENGEEAAETAEKIRRAIEEHSIECEDFTIRETISMGVCIAAVTPDTDPISLWRKADDCLYRAKEAGRNKVVTMMTDM